MQPDDELCLCFHVTKRKVENFIRLEKPKRVGQLSECFGAGTGCGWCRSFLQQMFTAAQKKESATDVALPTAEEYAQNRAKYVRSGGGTPPSGATPVTPPEPL